MFLIELFINSKIIDETVLEVDELAAARRATTKLAFRWSHLPKRDFSTKVGNYLKRRGFNYEIISQVVQDHWDTVADGTE